MSLRMHATEDGVVFSVKVVPGGSRRRIAGSLGDAVKVNLTAAPEKGRANRELTDFLAKQFHLPRAAVSIISGSQTPQKEVKIKGVTPEQLLKNLQPYLK